MFLRAREIHQRRAKVLLLQQPDVHLQSIRQREADFVLAMRQLLVDVRKFQDVLRERVHVFLRSESIRERNQQIQIANGFLPAPQRTCRRHRIHSFSRFLDMLRKRQRRRFRRADQEPSRGLLKNFHGLQNILFALLAKARQVPQLLLPGKPFHVRNRGRFEVRPKERHFLWPQRLQLQHVQNRRRIFLQQLLSQRVVPGLYDFPEMFDHPLADSRQLLQLFRLFDQLLDRFRQAVNQLRRLLVTAVAPNDRAINFQ